ncbi:translation factor [Annulohypoxylon truncatum]|uniref:translation factor n=1 Tax=Annulohypoxylon truncatum TaxID=327061 RepID=UPI0020072A91|nr:translation factor [Annulohypoxylon truncatum]KAI1208967.1 translation factor [Annulohypoxylon truncatum]
MSQDLPRMKTRVLRVPEKDLGKFRGDEEYEQSGLWEVSQTPSPSLQILHEAADYLRTKDTPVAFPTETVYGLGADATRSSAVRGIYTAKRRPADNPLIIHVSDLDMLRRVLTPEDTTNGTTNGKTNARTNGTTETIHDRIPEIYKPLIERFWPGPLTILLPNPTPSKLAPEVTAGLKTFGVRMPKSPLALSLIKLTGAPLAAPSANASTKPSPTMAEHVLEDLDGRIELILDGGPCHVGVESTVVDGLCDPPLILRPGGVSIDELRSCAGWEKIEKGYKDQSESGKAAPRAPGMKYKHYSPKAKVVLYEASFAAAKDGIQSEDFDAFVQNRQSQEDPHVGIIRTRYWKPAAGLQCGDFEKRETVKTETSQGSQEAAELDVQETALYDTTSGASIGKLMDISIGADTRSIAQGLFSALRELDRRGADIIFVEGTVDDEDIGAAVMNRLRKAASRIRS